MTLAGIALTMAHDPRVFPLGDIFKCGGVWSPLRLFGPLVFFTWFCFLLPVPAECDLDLPFGLIRPLGETELDLDDGRALPLYLLADTDLDLVCAGDAVVVDVVCRLGDCCLCPCGEPSCLYLHLSPRVQLPALYA